MNINDESFWPGKTRSDAFEELPLNRDLLLVGENQIESIRQHWGRYLAEPDGTNPPNPHEAVTFRWCSIDSNNEGSCSLNVCVDMSTRYHGANRTLPKKHFIGCVQFYEYEKRPYLIVSQDWFDDAERAMFALYAMVDVIGMKQLLQSQGRLETEQVSSLRIGIDAIALKHPDHVFMSFADNVLVKRNWSAMWPDYEKTYTPEKFIDIILEVREAILKALGLDSYAVITQGWNEFVESPKLHISESGNHVFLGSLGSPFADLMAIDAAARQSIKSQVHPPKTLYIAKQCFHSLHFSNWESKEILSQTLIYYSPAYKNHNPSTYLPINIDELKVLLKAPSQNHSK